MRPSLPGPRIRAVLGVLALAAPLITSCSGAVACPAVGHISGVTLHVTRERAANLATLGIELCQDGTCRSISVDPKATVTAGAIPLPTPSDALRAVPTRMADGSIDYLIEADITEHPLDLTTSGTDTSGWSIGRSHAVLTPTPAYDHGRECGGPTTARATLEPLGLRAG